MHIRLTAGLWLSSVFILVQTVLIVCSLYMCMYSCTDQSLLKSYFVHIATYFLKVTGLETFVSRLYLFQNSQPKK